MQLRNLGIMALVLCLGGAAHADGVRLLPDPNKPENRAALTPLESAQLDAALANIRAIGAKANADIKAIEAKANADVTPYAQRAEDICKAYGFHVTDLGGAVTVDFATGKITRKPTSAPPKK